MSETVLQEAERLINGDRQDTYGSASESFGRIAGLWSEYTGKKLTDLDVANMMVLLKVSRTKGQFHRDSYVDIGGYAALAERLVGEKAPTVEEIKTTAPKTRRHKSLGNVNYDKTVTDKHGTEWSYDRAQRSWGYRNGLGGRVNIGHMRSYTMDHRAPFIEVVEDN
ncbi:phosphofructokinase [Mycobacterium phage Anthony]|uniref:DUF6378 domain-containing protein n=1 Tax=Mycobacterium phage Anthony TaxID=2599857 RepID=A0A5J6TNW5_9CAUD|nr:phosphofructokinase [Mycobacterium phage Anthony]QFG10422.1 hypothetical protein PBI_ANTHONY_52 [Mycobacterium phage Anthony]